jgi:autotransporter-associated beta strand protein
MRRQLSFAAIAAMLVAANSSAAIAQTQYLWDTTTSGTVVTDGSGTWQVGLGNWRTGTSSFTYDQVWANGNDAVFGTGTTSGAGTAGTVTLGGTISARSLTLNQPSSGTYAFDLNGKSLGLSGNNGAITGNSGSGAVEIRDAAGGGGLAVSSASATFTLNGGPLTISAKVTGAGRVNVTGAGSLVLNNDANDFTGILYKQNGGFIQVSSIKNSGVASAAGAGSEVGIGVNGQIVYVGAGDSTNRTLRLTGAGTFELANNGSGALVWTGTIATSAVTGTRALTISGSNTGANEVQGAIADPRNANILGVTKNGVGSWILSGGNTYTGTTSVTAGTLQIGSGGTAGSLSASSAISVASGALLGFSRSNTITQGTDFNSVISGSGNVSQTGAGTLVLNGANTYTGTTTISAGTLQANAADVASTSGALGNGGDIRFTGGTLQFAAASAGTDYSARIKSSTSAIAIDTNGQAVTFGAALASSNIAGLTKSGSGTLTLAGGNAYAGATTISGGVLALGANGSFANSTEIKIGDAGSSGAVLDLTAKATAFALGSGQTLSGGGKVLVAPGQQFLVQGTFSPGNSPGLFTFDAGNTVLSGTTVMEIFGTSRATAPSHGSGFYDAVNIVDNGTLQFGGDLTFQFSSLFDNDTTFSLFTPATGSALTGNFTGVSVGGSFYTGLTWNQAGSVWKSSNTTAGQSLEFNATSGQLVIVPEPGTLALAGFGVVAAGLAAARRRRRTS